MQSNDININENEVYIEATDNKLLYIYHDLQLNLEISDTDIKPATDSPIEQLLASLIKQKIEYIDIDKAIDIGGDLVPILTNYCICCGNELEYASNDSKNFITCGMEACQYKSEEMLLDNYVKKCFVEDHLVSKFLLETAFYAINSNRRDKIFEPFPVNFLTQDIQVERGKMSALSNTDLDKYKDFNKLDEIVKLYSVSKLINVIKVCKSDQEIVDKIGQLAYKLIKFALKSNKTSLRTCGIINNFVVNTNYGNTYNKKSYMEDIEKFVQFEITYHPNIEEEFQKRVKEHGHLFLFHGSTFEN